MSSLYRISIRHPVLTVIAALVATLAVSPGVLRLRLRTDGHALVPQRTPQVLCDQVIRERFAIEDPLVVMIRTEHPDGIFNSQTLELVKKLTDELAQIRGVDPVNLFSLATEHNNRVKPGTLRFRTFLEPMPITSADMQRLRNDLLSIRLYTGTLVSADEHGTAVMVGTPPNVDRSDFYATIRAIVAAHQPLRDHVRVIGAPVAEALLGTHILADLGVPAWLLGTGVDQQPAGDEHPPAGFDHLRMLISRTVGLVPVAIAIMVLVFVISFRSITAALLPLSEVGVCLLVVFSLMGWFDVPVYLTIAVLPVILTAMGVADEVHIFNRYAALRCARPDESRIAVVTSTMDELFGPVTKTSITTAVAFLSFALAPIGPVQVFGIFTAVGVIFCMIWSLTVIPALLVLIPSRRLVAAPTHAASTPFHNNVDCDEPQRSAKIREEPRRDTCRKIAHGNLAKFVRTVVRRRYIVLAVAIILIALTPLGVRQVTVQDSWIDGFAPSSTFYQATQTFNEQFLGTHILLIEMDAGDEIIAGRIEPEQPIHYPLRLPASITPEPARLVGWRIRLWPTSGPDEPQPPPAREWSAWIDSAERDGDQIAITLSRRFASLRRQLRTTPDESIAFELRPWRLTSPELLGEIEAFERYVAGRSDCAVGGVIGTADYVKTTNFMARGGREDARRIPDTRARMLRAWNDYIRVRGVPRLRQVVDADYSRCICRVFLKDANFVDTARLLSDIRDYERQHLTPLGIKLGLAGDVAVSQTLIGAIVTTQTRSLLVSLVGILIVASVLGRSLWWGLCSVLPCALAVLVNFAAMGWLNIPLGVATSMFAGMTLGIGVDFAIHLVERYRLLIARGRGCDEALAEAAAEAGPAIIIDAAGIILGFGVLILSQVPANARLGALLALSVTSCLLATLLLLPAIIRLATRRQS